MECLSLPQNEAELHDFGLRPLSPHLGRSSHSGERPVLGVADVRGRNAQTTVVGGGSPLGSGHLTEKLR